MKKTLFLPLILIIAGCSKDSLHPKMKGIAFWETPNSVEQAIAQKSSNDLNASFSKFITVNFGKSFDDYQVKIFYGMGKPEQAEDRISKNKFKSLVSKEDITISDWNITTPTQAEGSFEFDSFYGEGKVLIRGIRVNNEWVLNYMAIPPKDGAGKDKPLVIFDYSESEVMELLK